MERIEVTDDVESENLKKIENHIRQIVKLKEIQTKLKEEKKKQICLTDPDAKSMLNNGKYEPCFNLQTAVDGKIS